MKKPEYSPVGALTISLHNFTDLWWSPILGVEIKSQKEGTGRHKMRERERGGKWEKGQKWKNPKTYSHCFTSDKKLYKGIAVIRKAGTSFFTFPI